MREREEIYFKELTHNLSIVEVGQQAEDRERIAGQVQK